MKKLKRLKRRSRGASIILVALFAVLLIVLVYVAFQLSLVMGGSREVRNAVDAAALNMAKRSVELKVSPGPIFPEVADTSGKVGMSNLCRVWGKAMLINANAQEMQQSGQIGTGSGNADAAFAAAQQVNDALCQTLQNKSTLDQYFNQFSTAKNASLLGAAASVTTSTDTTHSDFGTAMVDRGGESNLSFSPAQLPPGVTVKQVQTHSGSFIQGYTPFQVNGKEFCIATFHTGEMPHLISDSVFNPNRSGLPSNPIPNAFTESGLVNNSNTSLTASAFAEANPMRQYSLAIPYAYVSIIFGNRARWYVEGKKINETPYGNDVETQLGAKHIKLAEGGFLDGSAILGNEYRAGSLLALYTLPPGNHDAPLLKLVQRVQEIQPSFSLTQLKALMNSQLIAKGAPADARYLIYPVYNTPDMTNPKIEIANTANPGSMPAWLLKASQADGKSLPISTEGPLQDEPNSCSETITGGKYPTGKHWTVYTGTIGWQPGTGLNQCLGELQLARVTSCYFTGSP